MIGCTTSNAIFQKMRQVHESSLHRMEKICWSSLPWRTCNNGKHSGVVAQITEVAPDAKFVHFSIREVLATRKMPAILQKFLTEAVKVVNFFKSRATNSRLFSILCNEVASEHGKLLHTKVRWLSQGNVLSHLFDLHSELQIFLSNITSDLSNHFTDET
jgi:hypothetical protein